jgi:hypothetical protein
MAKALGGGGYGDAVEGEGGMKFGDVMAGAAGTMAGGWLEKFIETAAARKGVGQGWDNEVVWPAIGALGGGLLAMFGGSRGLRIAGLGAATSGLARTVGAFMARGV